MTLSNLLSGAWTPWDVGRRHSLVLSLLLSILYSLPYSLSIFPLPSLSLSLPFTIFLLAAARMSGLEIGFLWGKLHADIQKETLQAIAQKRRQLRVGKIAIFRLHMRLCLQNGGWPIFNRKPHTGRAYYLSMFTTIDDGSYSSIVVNIGR